MKYNNVTLKITLKILRQNVNRMSGLVFTGFGNPSDSVVPGKSDDSRNTFPLTGLCNRPVEGYGIAPLINL